MHHYLTVELFFIKIILAMIIEYVINRKHRYENVSSLNLLFSQSYSIWAILSFLFIYLSIQIYIYIYRHTDILYTVDILALAAIIVIVIAEFTGPYVHMPHLYLYEDSTWAI
jgi:hypothetical protein